MNVFRWNNRSGALAIAIALVLVLNPEIRALLLLVNAVGLEVVAFLVLAQARSFWPTIYTGIQHRSQSACPYVLQATDFTLRVTEGILLSRKAISNPIKALSHFLSCIHCPQLPKCA